MRQSRLFLQLAIARQTQNPARQRLRWKHDSIQFLVHPESTAAWTGPVSRVFATPLRK